MAFDERTKALMSEFYGAHKCVLCGNEAARYHCNGCFYCLKHQQPVVDRERPSLMPGATTTYERRGRK